MANRGMRFDVEVLTPEEITSFFEKFPRTRTGIRDRAFFAICLWGLLRGKEAARLQLHDLDLDNGRIVVQRGKGGRRRVAIYPLARVGFIQDWLNIRHCPDSTWVFCTRTGKPVDTSHMRRKVKMVGTRADIPRRVHVHGFRHTGAHSLATLKTDIRIISQQLGHLNTATTHRYIAHLGADSMQATLSALNW